MVIKMQSRLLLIITGYLVALTTVLACMWLVLELALPNHEGSNLLRALSAAMKMEIPEEVLEAGSTVGIVIFLLTVLSIVLTIINVSFTAFMTSHLITPKVKLVTSQKGVWTKRWDYVHEHILIRMVNFHGRDLVKVQVDAVLIVEEMRENDGKEELFMCYLPIENFTPRKVLILNDRAPWSIAIPALMTLSNSLTEDYYFHVGEPIKKSFSKGKKLLSCKRHIEILIHGLESKAYSQFIIRKSIPIDEQSRDGEYSLLLHKGCFASLPMRVEAEGDIEQYRNEYE